MSNEYIKTLPSTPHPQQPSKKNIRHRKGGNISKHYHTVLASIRMMGTQAEGTDRPRLLLSMRVAARKASDRLRNNSLLSMFTSGPSTIPTRQATSVFFDKCIVFLRRSLNREEGGSEGKKGREGGVGRGGKRRKK